MPDGKDVAQQAKNSFIKDAAKGMPVVEGVKGAEKVADNTPDRKNTPNTSKTDKTEGGENQKPANESGNDKKTTNEKDKTEGENTSKEKNPSDETEGRKVTREDNGGKTGSGVETSGEVKETKVEDLKEKIDDNDAVQDVLEGPRYSQERRISDALYKKLRSRTPTQKIQNMVNEGVPFPIKDPALPGREVKRFEADHIVPMNNIVRMEGFEKLTFEQQLEVLNNPKNFAGLSRAANRSRQYKSYSEWTHYKKGTPEEIKVDETFRQEMIEKEKELEKILQKQIDDLVEKNNKDNKDSKGA